MRDCALAMVQEYQLRPGTVYGCMGRGGGWVNLCINV